MNGTSTKSATAPGPVLWQMNALILLLEKSCLYFCQWFKDGEPVEHFMDIIPLKKANAQSIYSVLS